MRRHQTKHQTLRYSCAHTSPLPLPLPPSLSPLPSPLSPLSPQPAACIAGGGLLVVAVGMMIRRVAPPASEDDEAVAWSGSGVPGWLEALLGTRFFLACAAHPGSARNECNMFCIDCRATPAAFCYYCRSHRHASHRVIQIRRSSYHDVVRVTEVEDVLDIAGVQTYVINSARVLFLNERPQPRGAGAAAGKAAASPYNCEICGRALLDPFRFCSLGCKLVDTKTHGHGATAIVGGGNEAEAGGSEHGARPQGRRRKGTPHRAPFGS